MLFGGTSTLDTKQILQTALADTEVQATLLIVDSPGGMVSGTGDLAEVISSSDKPVWVFISDQCASAAYWIASQADQVFCNATGSVGSIGVYCVLEDTSQLYQNAGVKVHLIKAGEFKGTGVDGVPISDSAIAQEQAEVDGIYDMFVNAVANGRGLTTSKATELATGQMWLAKDARANGLIDGIASLEDTFNLLSSEINMNQIKAFSIKSKNAKADKSKAKAEDVKVETEVTAPIEKVEEVKEAKAETPAPEAKVEVKEAKVETPAPEAKVEPTDTVTIAKIDLEGLQAAAKGIAEQIQTSEADGFLAGVESERERMKALQEIAPEHTAFVIEQFIAGTDASKVAIAYAKLVTAENKELRKGSASTGASALKLGSLDNRESKQSKDGSKGFVKIKTNNAVFTSFRKE
jgi:signal peptide peptidase SppA